MVIPSRLEAFDQFKEEISFKDPTITTSYYKTTTTTTDGM
jgi:hypothetical protein